MLARWKLRRDSSDRFAALVGHVSLISTDVFDTLLLRNSRSERSRIALGEELFAQSLARRGHDVSPRTLADLRIQAQRLAFRALNLRGVEGEVRLADIVETQLRLLGLPLSLVGDRLQIENEVEKRSLVANRRLAGILKAHQRAGARIVAVSDTTLPAADVEELIRYFHGADLVDQVYSSADIGLTKRHGGLFEAVARAERTPLQRMVHIGDDRHADVHVPSTQGLDAHHAPRLFVHRVFRGIDRVSRAAQALVRGTSKQAAGGLRYASTEEFGRAIFGPIVTQFAMLIWIYAREAARANDPVLLFCARGGIGIREAFEGVLARLGLPLGVRRENIMISRLVAARAAVLARSDAAAQELDREFRSGTFADVASALGGWQYDLPGEWHAPFNGARFLELLFGPSGETILLDINEQNALFTRHFRKLIGASDRIILCDTGLYGSTQRLLACGFPDLAIETIQFARSNYKGHGEEHFPRVTGLLVQQNVYSPLDPVTSVLRYWHIIESLFEPAIPSVRQFAEADHGGVVGNCGPIDYGACNPADGNALLSGTLAYVAGLQEGMGGAAWDDARIAWRRLHAAVTQPTETDLAVLELEARSVDFGRSGSVDILQAEQRRGFKDRLGGIKKALWREGMIAREFPALKKVLLPALEAFHVLRGLPSRYR